MKIKPILIGFGTGALTMSIGAFAIDRFSPEDPLTDTGKKVFGAMAIVGGISFVAGMFLKKKNP